MRKSALFLALMAVLLVVTAIGPATAAPPTKVGLAYDVAGLGDGGFNDLAQSGALDAKADFHIKLFEKELVKKNGDILEPSTVVTKLAKKADIVIATGFLYSDAVLEAAAADAATDFAVVDTEFLNPPDNVLGATVAANEGSFLVGAAAALTSPANHVGFIGGIPFDSIRTYEAGYVAGATIVTPVNPVTIDIEYADTFSDTQVMYDIALAMYEGGADVIMHAAGGAGIGLFEAARDYSAASGKHVFAIGVDVDQYQQVTPDLQMHILTSMVKNVDVMVYDIIESSVNGTFVGGNDVWDLARNGVGYATSGGLLPPFVIDELDDLRAQIIAGAIVVPVLP